MLACNLRRPLSLCLAVALMLTLAACATPDQPLTKAQKGAIAGGISGAVVGGLIGKNSAKGAIIGGALGAATGGVIGNYMDKQAQELAEVAEVQRVGNGIIVTMKDRILFDVDQSVLKPESKSSLNRMAEILKKYDKTEITVAGHTDNTGSASHNQQLSERRANAVKLHLGSQGVSPSRMTVMGFGADQPLASNATAEGRAQNRRVELHITPDDRLLRDAQ